VLVNKNKALSAEMSQKSSILVNTKHAGTVICRY
jgi:hypothetical protein